jgi:hypothetical protein
MTFGNHFSREYHAAIIGTRRGNATAADVVLRKGRAHVVVRCDCGRTWRTQVWDFKRSAYDGPCQNIACTVQPRAPRTQVDRDTLILRLRAEWRTQAEIADMVGCAICTVRRVILRATPTPCNPREMMARQRTQRVLELVASGLTKTAVANRVGLSVDRVRKIARGAAA